MNILGKFLSDFKSEEQKQKRVEELSSTLVELSATKDYLVDTYNTLNKSIVTDNGDLENKRVEFNKGYLKQMAQFKLKERKLNEEKDYIEKSIDKTNSKEFSQRNNEEIYKSLDKIKTFYKRSKIDLNTYNDILKSITKKKTHYADICVLNEVGELLLLKRSNYDSTNAGAWVIPGGHVDPGEDCETAAKRELLEEAGISVDLLMVDDNPFKPTWSKVGEYDDENCHIDYFCLSGANMSRFEIILQEEEMRDYCWINRMDIDNYPMVFNMKENIKRVLYWEDTPQTKIIKKAYDLGLVSEEVLEKALKGIYGDTYQNRMLGRVGQKFDYTLSAYTIASNCSDISDCEAGIEEIKSVLNKVTIAPNSVYIRYHRLSEKLDKLKKQEYARISKQADRIITGKEYIERLSPSEEEGRVRGGKRNVEATLLLRGEEVTSDEDGFRVEELIRKQEKILKDYAKETGIWVDKDIIEKDWLFVDKGEEAKVYDDGNYIKKVFDYQFFSLSPLEFIDNRISLHNFMFEETSYELVGFTETNRGLSFILRQPYIQNYSKTPVSVIREEMIKNGFNVMDEKSYYNDNYIVEDLHHKNVLTDNTTGKLFFIDTVISLNEEGEGYGGKRKYNKIRVTSKTIEKSFNNISELYLKGVIDDETFQKAEELYFEKAFSHKYISKKPDGKGHFIYIYDLIKNNLVESEGVKFNISSVGREDWDEHIINNDDFHKEVIYMTPDEFIKRAGGDRFDTNIENVEKIKTSIGKDTILPTPILTFMNKYSYENGLNSNFHDGNHRVKALKELGINKIPVIISYEYEDIVEKGFGTGIGGAAQIGEVRKRKDGTKWKKVASTGQMSDWKQIKEDGSEIEQKEGEDKQKKGEEPKKKLSPKEIVEAAKSTSEEALNSTIKQSDDPKLREAAHKELDRRTKEEHVQEEKEGEKTDDKKEGDKKLIHQLPSGIVEKVKKEGFKYSSNSMYGEGVYFSNKNAYGDKDGYSSIEVELKPHKQLKVDRDIDVPSKIKEITGLDTYSGEKTRKALIESGYGSIKFPTENGEDYTVVLDKDLIKIKDKEDEKKGERKIESKKVDNDDIESLKKQYKEAMENNDFDKLSEISNKLKDNASKSQGKEGVDQSKYKDDRLTQNFTEEEKDSLDTYASIKYKEINKQMRDGNLSKDNKKIVDSVLSAMNKNKLSEDLVVYRGSGGNYDASNKNSFTSTSTSEAVAKNFARGENSKVDRLVIPKGTPVAYMGGAEREVILPPNWDKKEESKEIKKSIWKKWL